LQHISTCSTILRAHSEEINQVRRQPPLGGGIPYVVVLTDLSFQIGVEAAEIGALKVVKPSVTNSSSVRCNGQRPFFKRQSNHQWKC